MTKGSIRRGCAQKQVFSFPKDLASIKNVVVVYSQGDTKVVKKDVKYLGEDNIYMVSLEREDTLLFTEGAPIEIQALTLLESGSVLASEILRLECTKGLYEGGLSA